MKIYTKGIFAFVVFVLLSCSKDEGINMDTSSEPEIDIILIGQDAQKVYQYNYNSSEDTEIQSDLTQELGLENTYLTLHQEGNVLSFYTYSSGNFSLIQKNVETGASSLEENFYRENFERSILWGTNSEESIYLGFFEPRGSSNFGVLTIDIESGSQSELLIEDAIETSYSPIYYRGKLILTYLDGSDNYQIAIVDAATNTIQKRFEFGALVPNVFIDESGNVVIMKSNLGENFSYATYDSSTYESSGDFEFSLKRYFAPASITARFINQKFFYYQLFVQPAEVQFGPASFDLNTNVETVVDMIGIVNEVEKMNGKSIQLISQGIDEKSGSFLMGYTNLNNSNTVDGGMIIVSFEGELLKNIQLPFVPTYFLHEE